jgi:hypothetical protein
MKTEYKDMWDWRVENDNKPIWTRPPKVWSLVAGTAGLQHWPLSMCLLHVIHPSLNRLQARDADAVHAQCLADNSNV